MRRKRRKREEEGRKRRKGRREVLKKICTQASMAVVPQATFSDQAISRFQPRM